VRLRLSADLAALALILAATALLFGAIGWWRSTSLVPLMYFTRDAVALRHAPWYTGMLSQLGIMTWVAAATAALLGALALPAGRTRSMLATFGAITAYIALDDAFLLHEVVIPHSIGLPESGVYALYLLLTGAAALCFWRELLAHSRLLLGASIVLLGAPVVLDMLQQISPALEPWMAASKLAGLWCWAAYWLRRSLQALRETHR